MKQYFPRKEITVDEWRAFCANSTIEGIDILNIYKYLDINGDNSVSLDEFDYRMKAI